MKSKNYKYILLFITITILATISLQIYWNIKNYAENEQRLINDVQLAFDNSIEHYYVEDAKNNFVAFTGNDSVPKADFFSNLVSDTVFKNNIPGRKKPMLTKQKEFTKVVVNEFPHEIKGKISSIKISKEELNPSKISSVRILRGKKAVDSISKIESLANKIIISMTQDSLEFDKISRAFDNELLRKNIQIKYGMEHFKADSSFQKYGSFHKSVLPLSTFSKSIFLPSDQKLKLSFSNPTIQILQRSMVEIILSLLLSLSIIFCLLYLLKTINRQKKIDDMKNDLISNITHEFKTPITTVSTALEGIKNFNDVNDTEKTNRYIDISNQQLKKLEIMVEKLLETASLETDKIQLNKELVNVVELLKNNIEKHEINSNGKTFNFESDVDSLLLSVDNFHIENAISNLIDNALKYGGTQITISLKTDYAKVFIAIEDNGKGIEKNQREKIFEKFYRIQKGNVHDVKGFGIGLYYSKKIIEKHHGKIELIVDSKTTFKIMLPNE